jgi:hypothetical protein
MMAKHELEELVDHLRTRDENMLSEINGMFGGGMNIENRIALADARATDALSALCVVIRYVIELEKKLEAARGEG